MHYFVLQGSVDVCVVDSAARLVENESPSVPTNREQTVKQSYFQSGHTQTPDVELFPTCCIYVT